MKNLSKNTLAIILAVFTFASVCLSQGSKPPKVRYVEYDADGNVPIGTAGTGSKVAVGGVIESTSGGVKFPDGSTQTSAGLTTIVTNSTLTGKGTADSPLGVAAAADPDSQPFYARRIITSGVLTTVPAGKRLVIDYVTASFAFTSISTFPGAAVQLVAGSNYHLIPATLVRPAVDNGTYFYLGSPMKMYVEPGQTLSVSFDSSSDAFSREIQVTGHFVDVP